MTPRENPFRTARTDCLDFRPQGTDWDTLLEGLEALEFRGAIVGPHGSGKTTLLEALESRLVARGLRCRVLRLGADDEPFTRRRLATEAAETDADEVLLLDGADLLPWMRFSVFARRMRHAGGIVVTSHREGLLPTWHRTSTSPALARELVVELLGHGAPQSWLDAVTELHRTHRGNLRELLRALYDRAAALEPTGLRGEA